jgi:hypothetical protein
MTGHRPLGPSIALSVLVISLTAGCSNTNDPPTATATRPEASSSSTTTGTPKGLTTAVPAQVSDFPDGVYRSQLTLKRLQEVGMDDTSYAGTWTLTARSGTYRLECRAIANPGVDCGNHFPGGPSTVEMGKLRGTSPTVWFVHDMAQMSKLTGCTPNSQSSKSCGPDGGYHQSWKTVARGIAFSDFVGLGDEATRPALNEWTAQFWTRIS